MESVDSCVSSVQLSDRLTNSGTIAVIITRRVGVQVIVEEVCISCRAMGRKLENEIILLSLRNMPIFDGCKEVIFNVKHGPRNRPGLTWLASLLGIADIPSQGAHIVSSQKIIEYTDIEGVSKIIE